MNPANIVARTRLCGGMILMTYVTCHLSNLALGVWSLRLMDLWRPVIMGPWQTWIGQALLYCALASHLALGLLALSKRRGAASMTPTDLAQLALGLLIPPLLASHVLASRGAAVLDDFHASYAWFLFMYWKQAPLHGLQQVFVVSAAWIHGCLGLHVWLRLRPWWPQAAGFVYPLVFLLPILALLGFVEAGKEAIALFDGGDPIWASEVAASSARMATISPTLMAIQNVFLGVYAAALGLALAASVLSAYRRRSKAARIEYLDGPTARTLLGLSILEASRAHGLPHASACGGHGRCATCRVKVVAGMDNLSPANPQEAELLTRMGFEADVRLACQAFLTGPAVVVQRLVPADAEEEAARDPLGWRHDMMGSLAAGAQ